MHAAQAEDAFTYDSSEQEVFSDTFSDNSKGWTLGDNSEIKDGKWGPKAANVPGGSSWVTASLNLSKSVVLSDGTVAIYFTLSTNAPTGADSCKTRIGLDVEGGSRMLALEIIPRVQDTLLCFSGRNGDGAPIAAPIVIQEDLVRFKGPGIPISYRVVVGDSDGFTTVEPFVWNGAHWHSLGPVASGEKGASLTWATVSSPESRSPPEMLRQPWKTSVPTLMRWL